METRADFLRTDKQIVPVSGAGAHMRALATAVEHQRARGEVD
jgi:hypothetical protein